MNMERRKGEPMNAIPQQQQSPGKQWWQTDRVRWFALAVLAVVVAAFFIWWIYFRSFVSTNDARIATNIIRVAPVGVGGVIEKVAVEEGDQVRSGEVIVEIDHRVPEAQLNKAKANFQLAKLELDRARSLVSNNVSALRDLDRARTNYNIAQAELQLADVNEQNTYLKSPIDGIVVQKLAEPGNIIEPGQVAVAIADVDHAWVSANIEETNIGRVKPGQSVSISVDEGGSLTGKVLEINAATAAQFSLLPAENASGNYTKVVQRIPVKVALDPHPGRILKAGQSVTIKIRVR
jgi:membrane fusion protein, multidrug efflux system